MIRQSLDEGIENDGTKDAGRGPIIISSLGPPNTLIRHCWHAGQARQTSMVIAVGHLRGPSTKGQFNVYVHWMFFLLQFSHCA